MVRQRLQLKGMVTVVDSYYEAMKDLGARYGKLSLVVKVTLNRLRKTLRIQNDKPHEVRNLSDMLCQLQFGSLKGLDTKMI